MSKYVMIVALLFLAGCGPDPRLPGQSATDYYNVVFLFETDGCRLYRFHDGYYRYFASCASVTGRVPSGKTSRPDEVITGVPGL